MTVSDVTPENIDAVREFLETQDTALFLLSNLSEHGPRIGDSMNSGTFKCVTSDSAVIGVFCLTRRGNLLAETGGRVDLARTILEASGAERIPLSGVLGERRCVDAIRGVLLESTTFVEEYRSQELLYRLEVRRDWLLETTDHGGRLLEPADFDLFDPIRVTSREEEGLPADGTIAERRASFERDARARRWWGAFDAGRLRAIAALNAVYKATGQVGGVYTVPEQRQRGVARELMRVLMADAVRLHGLQRLVLFTGETNVAAQRLYESLGFVRIGEYGLLFGAPR